MINVAESDFIRTLSKKNLAVTLGGVAQLVKRSNSMLETPISKPGGSEKLFKNIFCMRCNNLVQIHYNIYNSVQILL